MRGDFRQIAKQKHAKLPNEFSPNCQTFCKNRLTFKEMCYLCTKFKTMSYKSRIADQLLREKLEAMGAVLIGR